MAGLDYNKNVLASTAGSSLSTAVNGAKASNPATSYAPKSDNVAQNVADVVNQNSPLMKQAKTAGLQAANSRGLLNSSMAGQASQAAVMDYAVPIGSQQAQQNYGANQAFADFKYADAAQTKDIDFRNLQQDKEIDHQQYTQSQDITNQQYMQGKDITNQQYMQGQDLDHQASEGAYNRAVTESGNTAATAANFESLYQNTVANINSNTNLDAETREQQLLAASTIRDKQYYLTEQIYRVDLTW